MSPSEKESRDASHSPWSGDSLWRLESCGRFFLKLHWGRIVHQRPDLLWARPALARTHSRGRIEFEMRCIILQRFNRGVRSRRWKKEHSMKRDRKLFQSFPKVLLHEHLDGVLRPQTVIELAKDVGYMDLPTTDPQALAEWFHQGANQGSLAKYLEGFVH